MNEWDGLSIVLVNSSRGSLLLEKLDLLCENVPILTAISGNKNLSKPIIKGSLWDYYMNSIRSDTIDIAIRSYKSNNKMHIFKRRFERLIPVGLYNFLKRTKRKLRRHGRKK